MVAVFFVLHYLFVSSTAHTTAPLPVMLAAASGIPGLGMHAFALLLLPSIGIMGIITPYGTGPCPVHYGRGYLPASLYWRPGTIFWRDLFDGMAGFCDPLDTSGQRLDMAIAQALPNDVSACNR